MPIRKKILYSTIALTFTLLLLFYCSLRGVYAYRNQTISIGKLSSELNSIEHLRNRFDDLREDLVSPSSIRFSIPRHEPHSVQVNLVKFLGELDEVEFLIDQHRLRIEAQIIASDPLLATKQEELKQIGAILDDLEAIETEVYDLSSTNPSLHIYEKLGHLSSQFRSLFGFLTDRMRSLRDETRVQYRSWIALIIASATASLINVAITFWFFRHSIVKPFKLLLNESQAIAGGEFDRRIELESKDELADLAEAMNSMTDRFVQIRDNLNQEVQQRTQEVVRSEQLASVGFLAAGVAHEINNPLASIAWSAEALEGRLHEILHPTTANETANRDFDAEEIEVLRDYLRQIQEEAFRCKGITERLLDFSRLGESSKKQETDIHEAISSVCELVRHLGQYRNRKLNLRSTPGIFAWVSPTEFKQVVLNLLTNALDASEDGQQVDVLLETTATHFTLTVSDDGCGMTEEVRKHLFEPFFTRRRDGRGTGLGLSITYRIVEDHDGTLVPFSAGPGQGSTMKLTVPLLEIDAQNYERRRAA